MQPGPFLLERLVAIFEALHPTTDAVGCSDELRGAEMLAQVTSLVQLRLLVAVNAGNEVRLGAPPSPRLLPYSAIRTRRPPDGGLSRRRLPVQVQRGLRDDGAALVGAQPARRAQELL